VSAPTDLQDVLIIGGGINGAGIARDAAGRGLRVTLCEQADLAAGTSSASTKLVHGGLRYLEHGDFRLVRESLEEREILLRIAPHLVRPLRFVLPHVGGMRPAWMLRVGLFLYDRLGGRRRLAGSERIDLTTDPAGEPLAADLRVAFEYSDCWADDARLVVLNAVDAAERGARILTRSKVVSAEHDGEAWHVRMARESYRTQSIRARALVNATGPWVAAVGTQLVPDVPAKPVRLVKGSHIVTRRLYAGDRAYVLQGQDSRIVFVIPYERDFTLIGTTEAPHTSMEEPPAISSAERAYLIDSVNRYLRRPVGASDVVSTYAGVRLLVDDAGKAASAVSREYVLDLDTGPARPPCLTVYGGKLTTYRSLAEKAVSKLQSALGGSRPGWTATAVLPGGDVADADFDRFAADMRARYAWLDGRTLDRLLHAYGTRIEAILGAASRSDDLGEPFAHGLHAAEIDYLLNNEFARTAEDILWRRSKLGLRFDAADVAKLARRLGSDEPEAAQLPPPGDVTSRT
jgi:glycerol-3-phosphate dehydrogenase